MSNHDRIRALVFDLDGTLFDTLPSLAGAANEVLAGAGLQPIPLAPLAAALSDGLLPMFRRALVLQADRPDDQQAASLESDYMEQYTRHWLRRASPFAGVLATLRALRAHGVQLGVCTNRDRASTEILLGVLGVPVRFDAMVALGDAPRPKPAPDPLLQALQQLQLPASQVLFVGDSGVDARCAAAAGVAFAAHLRGYAAQACDLVPQVLAFDRYEDLASWVLARLAASTEALHA